MTATKISGASLASRQRYVSDLQTACVRMTGEEPIAQLPSRLQWACYDLRRAEPRRVHLLGEYPDLAELLALRGVAPDTILRPAQVVAARVLAIHGLRQQLSLLEATLIETERQHAADAAQLRVLHRMTSQTLEDAYHATMNHRDAADQLAHVYAVAMHGQPTRSAA